MIFSILDIIYEATESLDMLLEQHGPPNIIKPLDH